jgi:hypothetical protein
MRRSVGHIQTTWEFFQHSKKARVLERACIVAKKGAKAPIFREICSSKKCTPSLYAVNGALA